MTLSCLASFLDDGTLSVVVKGFQFNCPLFKTRGFDGESNQISGAQVGDRWRLPGSVTAQSPTVGIWPLPVC